MGKQRVKLLRVRTLLALASVLVTLIAGCWSPPQIIKHLRTPGHTARFHAPVSLPAFTASGDKVVVCGDQFKRYSAANELEFETVLPVLSDWSIGEDYAAVYNDTLGNLYLDLGDLLAGINDAGEIMWRINWSVGEGMLFPYGGGILVINQIGSTRYLLKLMPDGTQGWRKNLNIGQDIHSWVAVSSELIYVLQTNQLMALDMHGTEVWRTPFGNGSGSYTYLSNCGNLTVVCGYENFYAFDETGAELWSRTPPAGFNGHGEVQVLSPDRIALEVGQNFSNPGGLLILDGSGKQISLLEGFNASEIAIGDDSSFVSLETVDHSRFVNFHSLATGEVLWNHNVPEQNYRGEIEEGDVVEQYYGWPKPFFAPDGMIYFLTNSTLYELDQTGVLIHSFPSTVVSEKWVDAQYTSL